jgi:hypothetical protein
MAGQGGDDRMSPSQPEPAAKRTLPIDELTDLRAKTEAVSQFLRKRLEGHLATLRVAFAPRWVLGKHVRSGVREDLVGSDAALEQLKSRYAQYRGRPFLLPRELEDGPVSIEGVLDLHAWEYTLELGDKPVKMTSPVRWVANYRSGYNLGQLRESIAAKQPLRAEDSKGFVLGALVLVMLLEKTPGLAQLLTDLRYEVKIAPSEELGGLPLVTISAGLPSFKPSDDLILSATRFSGVPEFIELIDLAALDALADPFAAAIRHVVGR